MLKCSECNGEVIGISLMSNPPIPGYMCLKCGKTKYIKQEKENDIIIDMK